MKRERTQSPAKLEPVLLSLDGAWDFAYTPEKSVPLAPPGAEAFTLSVQVPGYLDDQAETLRQASWWAEARFNPDYKPIHYPMGDYPPDSSLPYLVGVGWYQRTLEVPKQWQGRRITLHLGGATLETDIFVNGQFIGHHLGHTSPFAFDLTDHLRLGEQNLLTIAVSNIEHTIGGCALRGYQGYSMGLYRSVTLHAAGPGRIEAQFVRLLPDLKTIRWQVDLKAPRGANKRTKLQWRICELDGTTVREGSRPVRPLTAGESYRLEWNLPAEGLAYWSGWDPHRYLVETRWVASAAVWDRVEQTAGFRSLTTDGQKLRLNGRPLMLRGVCDHCYFAPSPTPPVSVDYYRHLLKSIKQVGYNFMRCHTWIPPQEYMQAADELGMFFQVELPDRGSLELWREILTQSRHHPSVVIYCCGNEEYCDEKKITFFEQANTAAKELDPGALIMPMEAMRGIDYFWAAPESEEYLAQVTVKEPFWHHPARLARVTKCSDIFSRADGILSYGPLHGDWRELAPCHAIYQHPILSHEIGILGCYLDLSLENRYTGGRIPPDLFRDTRERLAEAGRLHMAEKYHRNSACWQSLIRKYMFEKARKCDTLAGFDNLGGWDSHWHRSGYACGTLNEFFELKYGDTVEALLQCNGESVLLLDLGKQRNFYPGESFRALLQVSLFGGRPLQDGTLTWRVVAGEEMLLEGVVTGLAAPDGAVTEQGDLTFAWPEVSSARKIRLELELRAEGYGLSNAWDCWLFPKQPPVAVTAAADQQVRAQLESRYPGLVPISDHDSTRLRLVSRLTAEDVEHLAQGGTVLLLGCDPLPARPTSFSIGVSGRPMFNLATVVNEHPVFTGIPHEGFCDWQFHSLVEEGHCTIFNDLPIAFAPVLEIVSSYKDFRWQAALWEGQTEGGRLFVMGSRIDLEDPATAALLDGLLSYLQAGAYVDAPALKLADLRTFVGAASRRQEVGGTDMGYDARAQE
jgi:hypothetical protein